MCTGIASASTLEVVYTIINKKRESVSREEVEAMFSADTLEEMEDRSPLFRYSLYSKCCSSELARVE